MRFRLRILYGVVGEGMGHATRSRAILGHLLHSGHELLVVVSGRAHAMLVERFRGRRSIRFEEIHGLSLTVDDTGGIDKSQTLIDNLAALPGGWKRNVEVYERVVGSFRADVVLSDFESWAYVYGRVHDLPVVSIDNMQIINRCLHEDDVIRGAAASFRLAKVAVKAKLPDAYHYLVTSFFYPKVRKKRTTLVPPILRPEVLSAERMEGSHVVVYQTAATQRSLVPLLRRLDGDFRLYGAGRDGREGNVTLRPFSERGFIQDLRSARAVIATGGFSLMTEAVHLGVPMLALPIPGQFEQHLNAAYLAKLGYGESAASLDEATVSGFLSRIPDYQDRLSGFERHDNSVTFSCLDEILGEVAAGRSAPIRLRSPSCGSYPAQESHAD